MVAALLWLSSYLVEFALMRWAPHPGGGSIDWRAGSGVLSGSGFVTVGRQRLLLLSSGGFGLGRDGELVYVESAPTTRPGMWDVSARYMTAANDESFSGVSIAGAVARLGSNSDHGSGGVGIYWINEHQPIDDHPILSKRLPPPVRGIAIHWLWLVGFATLLAIVRWRRYLILRRRHSRSLCVACGYDLRAATSDVCSECGVTRRDS